MEKRKKTRLKTWDFTPRTLEIKAAAAKLFKVDVSVFDTGIEGLTDQPPPPPEKIDWQAEALATRRQLVEVQEKYIRLLEELRNGRK